MSDERDYTPPSLSEFQGMSAVRQRQVQNSFDSKRDEMNRKRRENTKEEKKRNTVKKKLYLQQNFTSQLDIMDTDYPPFAAPGEDVNEDAERGPYDEKYWGPDGRWYYYHRYEAAKIGVPLQHLFK